MSTTDDISYLIGLARDKSVESRKRLVAVVSDIFHSDQAILTEYERALITEILHKLIYDLAVPVRQVLAGQITASERLPREVAAALANDEIEIAAPILLNNEALLDVELIEAVRHRALEHQLTLALRRAPFDAQGDATAEIGAGDLLQELLDGGDVKVVDAALSYLIDQSRSVDSFQEPLLRREQLSERLARKMVLWILAALRAHLLDRFEVDQTALDDCVEAAAGELNARLGEERTRRGEDRCGELARMLAATGQITPQRLIQALRQGEIALVIAMLAHLTGLRLPLVRRLMFEPGGEGMVVACRAIGLDKAVAASIYLLLRRSRPGDWAADPRDLSRVLSLYDRVQPAAAQAVLARWRRDPDFLYAIKTVEEARLDAAAV